MDELEQLEHQLDEAEAKKKLFVREHPKGEGDQQERARLYIAVEKARKALRQYRLQHPELHS